MPELWFAYGNVEIPIEIKMEDLAGVLERSDPAVEEKSLTEKLEALPLDSQMSVIMCDASAGSQKVLSLLSDASASRAAGAPRLDILVPTEIFEELRKVCRAKGLRVHSLPRQKEVVGEVSGHKVTLPKLSMNSEHAVVVSQVGFDPLFGFSGSPSFLARLSGEEVMSEIIRQAVEQGPMPGKDTGALRIALEICKLVPQLLSLQVLQGRGGNHVIFEGDVEQAHRRASEELLRISLEEIKEPFKAIIASPGDPSLQSHLASSLHQLWNIIGGLEENGAVALLSESSEGLGSDALKLYSQGRLRVEDAIRRGRYWAGIEDLIYLKSLAGRFDLLLVSTLPRYYVEDRLGLRALTQGSAAVNYILGSMAKKVKILAVPRLERALLRVRS